MKKLLLPIIPLLFFTNTFGQKTELSVSLNSGLFSFSGLSAEKTTFINYSNSTNTSYTNNPYGSRAGICYGLSGNLKRLTKRNFIAGLDLGFENLKSEVFINKIIGYTETSPFQYNAKGKTFLNYSFINIYLNTGYQFYINNISFDIIGGIEVGYCTKASEEGNATADNGTIYTTSLNRKTIKTDIRPRVQFFVNHNRIGGYIGYSYGLNNYLTDYIGGTFECYARVFRFGLTYRIK